MKQRLACLKRPPSWRDWAREPWDQSGSLLREGPDTSRALAEEHLGASAVIGDAVGRELEALCPGWAQPATFR